jgi:putative restriction endonuclease
MDTLERASLLKSARENGWENCLVEEPSRLVLGSARHRAQVTLLPMEASQCWQLFFRGAPLNEELMRSCSNALDTQGVFTVSTVGYLSPLLRRAAELAFALPNHGEALYQERVAALLPSGSIANTEVERLVRQRVGQDTYRELLLQYWGGACAVTGVAVSHVLRASHAKPWAACESDAERLDVYNGLLLVANLDALFDRGLITFSDNGELRSSKQIEPLAAEKLGCLPGARLRWVDAAHTPYLEWHRTKVWKG